MESTQYGTVEFYRKRVENDFKKLDTKTAERFITQLQMVAWGVTPEPAPTELKHSVGSGVFELRRNGRPAKRCVYVIAEPGKVVVLHVFKKTCEGVDKKNMETADKRYKSWLESRKGS